MTRVSTAWTAHGTTSDALGALAREGATGALSGERGVVHLVTGRGENGQLQEGPAIPGGMPRRYCSR